MCRWERSSSLAKSLARPDASRGHSQRRGHAVAVYRDTLGASVSEAVPQPDHGVSTIFITLPNTKIELLEPLGARTPPSRIPCERNPDGGRSPRLL